MLKFSAVYPREFGNKIASMMPRREPRVDLEIDLGSYPGDDDRGALDDLLKGRDRTWWRNL